MGADGHSNNTGELHWQAIAEALLWLKDTERSFKLSPVLFCLGSEYAANAIQGTSQVHKNAVLIEKGKQLYLEEARRRAGGFSFTHVPTLKPLWDARCMSTSVTRTRRPAESVEGTESTPRCDTSLSLRPLL
jgi:hypothetical protein